MPQSSSKTEHFSNFHTTPYPTKPNITALCSLWLKNSQFAVLVLRGTVPGIKLESVRNFW